MSIRNSEETGTGKIHPRAAKNAGKIEWDLKDIKYKGREDDGSNTWGEKIYEPNDKDFENPIGEDVRIVDLTPDPTPPTLDQSQL